MYTYEEIKSELLSQISQLLDIEPRWQKCSNCPHSGFCCVSANVTLYEYEWNKIQSYLLDNPNILQLVKNNFVSRSRCYFRVSDKCLIHDIRPLNCIFTPYQAIYCQDKLIHYSTYDENCKTIVTTHKPDGIDLSQSFIPLPTGSSYIHYLLLNHWYFKFEMNSSVTGTTKYLHEFLESFLAQH